MLNINEFSGLPEERIVPGQTALLVVDIQNDFCAKEGYLSLVRQYDVGFVDEVVSNIETIAEQSRKAGVLVVWVRSFYDFKYLHEAQIRKRRQEGCCLEGTWGTEFYKVSPKPGDVVVTKHGFSAFHGTDLDCILRGHGIRTLLLAGVATNVCVDFTLREGFSKGYGIVLLEDCVGSNNKLGHVGTISTVKTNIGMVVGVKEMSKILEAPASALYEERDHYL